LLSQILKQNLVDAAKSNPFRLCNTRILQKFFLGKSPFDLASIFFRVMEKAKKIGKA